jgi:hypothetical protein
LPTDSTWSRSTTPASGTLRCRIRPSRLISLHPDWLQWQVIQNANIYEEGFTEIWDGIRHVLWANRNAETEAPLEAFLGPEAVKAIYLTGHPDPAKISPDNWNLEDIFFTPAGGEAYLRDLPDAKLVRLDSGHFAVEDCLQEIDDGINGFYDETVM